MNLHKENVEKAVDFYFSDICVTFRSLPNLTDENKDIEIKVARLHLTDLKQVVLSILAKNDVVILQ